MMVSMVAPGDAKEITAPYAATAPFAGGSRSRPSGSRNDRGENRMRRLPAGALPPGTAVVSPFMVEGRAGLPRWHAMCFGQDTLWLRDVPPALACDPFPTLRPDSCKKSDFLPRAEASS